MHNVQNAMFAAAMAYSMGIGSRTSVTACRRSTRPFFQAPGRMNVFDGHPFKVILDYGHNPSAIAAMRATVDSIPVSGRRIVVLAAPGDRRDEDIREAARAAAGGSTSTSSAGMTTRGGAVRMRCRACWRRSCSPHGVPDDHIRVIPDEAEAVDAALETAAEGDLVLIFGDQIARTWRQVTGPGVDEPPTGGALGGAPEVAEIPGAVAGPGADPPAGPPGLEWPADWSLDFDLEERKLVRDERGVRIAREPED